MVNENLCVHDSVFYKPVILSKLPCMAVTHAVFCLLQPNTSRNIRLNIPPMYVTPDIIIPTQDPTRTIHAQPWSLYNAFVRDMIMRLTVQDREMFQVELGLYCIYKTYAKISSVQLLLQI